MSRPLAAREANRLLMGLMPDLGVVRQRRDRAVAPPGRGRLRIRQLVGPDQSGENREMENLRVENVPIVWEHDLSAEEAGRL